VAALERIVAAEPHHLARLVNDARGIERGIELDHDQMDRVRADVDRAEEHALRSAWYER